MYQFFVLVVAIGLVFLYPKTLDDDVQERIKLKRFIQSDGKRFKQIQVVYSVTIDWIVSRNPQIPVIWRNSSITRNWNAIGKWDFEHLDRKINQSLNAMVKERKGSEYQEVEMRSLFKNKPLDRYRDLIPFDHSNVKIDIQSVRLRDLKDRQVYAMAKASMDQLPKEMYRDLKGWKNLMIDKNSRHDSDVWITTPGSTSHAHYDLQHNFYVEIYGEKRFLMLAPSEIKNLHLHPFLHSMQRQIQPIKGLNYLSEEDLERFPRIAEISQSNVLFASLEKGDILYIPPFWIHSGTSILDSVSIGTCSRSVMEDIVDEFENHPLPFESEWTDLQKLYGFLEYVDLTARLYNIPGCSTGLELLQDLFESRYFPLFQEDVMREILQNAGMPFDCKNWSWKKCACRQDANLKEFKYQFKEKAKLYSNELFRKTSVLSKSVGIEIIQVLLYDTIEQWAHVLLGQNIDLPLIFAFCRDSGTIFDQELTHSDQ
jgi:oxalate decarboxylase/phosphoglucose isomerase-like protein (cupin superfamily)